MKDRPQDNFSSQSSLDSTLVIFDGRIEHIEFLQRRLVSGIAAQTIAPDADAIAAISQVLAQHPGITSLYLVAHGEPGRVQVGRDGLDLASLDQNAEHVAQWRSHLADNATISLVSCDVAQADKSLLEKLSALTGAAVAGARSRVGSVAKGGRWVLDAIVGDARSVWPWSAATLEAYSGVFDTATVSTLAEFQAAINNASIDTIVLGDDLVDQNDSFPTFNINRSLTIDGQNNSFVFGRGLSIGAGATVELRGLGFEQTSRAINIGGGATLIGDNLRFVGNGGAGDGGGIRASGAFTISISDSIFISNFAAEKGGAIFASGVEGNNSTNNSTIELIDTTFASNSAFDPDDGNSSNLWLSGTRVNLAGSGLSFNSGGIADVGNNEFFDEAVPTFTVSFDSRSLNEGAPARTATIELVDPDPFTDNLTLDEAVTINYTIDGAPGSVTFAAGSAATATRTVNVAAPDNDISDPDRTISFNIADPGSYEIMGQNNFNIPVVDDEVIATVTAVSDASEPGTAGEFLVTLGIDDANNVPVNVAYSIGGTAIGNGLDYELQDENGNALVGNTLTFSGGGPVSRVVRVVPTDDSTFEGDETVELILQPSSDNSYDLGAESSATLAIADNENPPTVSVAVNPISVNEGDSPNDATFTITLDAPAGDFNPGGTPGTWVYFSVNDNQVKRGEDIVALTDINPDVELIIDQSTGSSTNPSIYRVLVPEGSTTTTVTVDVIDDTTIGEFDERLRFVLLNSFDGIEPYVLTPNSPSNVAELTIVDDDVRPTITVDTSLTVDPVEGGPDGSVTITADAPVTQNTTIAYRIIESGSNPADLVADLDGVALEGTVTLLVGEQTATINLPATNDSSIEDAETFTVEVLAATDSTYSLGSTTSDELTIAANDSNLLYTVGLTSSGVEVTEGGVTNAFTVTLNQPAPVGGLAIDYVVSGGTTAAASDYVAPSGTVTVPEGQTTAQIFLQTLDNGLDEGNRVLELSLEPTSVREPGRNYDADSSATTANVTITDDDTAGITIRRLSDTTSERGDSATFEVVLQSQPTGFVDIFLLTDDPTEGGVNFASQTEENQPPSVAFNAGNWDQPQLITVSGNDDAEADGNVVYTHTPRVFTNDSNYENLDPSQLLFLDVDGSVLSELSLTNIDDDGANVLVSNITGIAAEDGTTTATYTLQLTQTPTEAIPIALDAGVEAEVSLDGGTTFTSVAQVDLSDTVAQTIIVRAVDDSDIEGGHAAAIAHTVLSNGDANYPTSLAIVDAVVPILDNDVPTVAIATTFDASEESLVAGGFGVVLDEVAPAGGITVNYTVQGGSPNPATAGTDYLTLSGSLFIAEGETGGLVDLRPIFDDIDELPSETVEIALTTGSGYSLGTNQATTINIFDDDQAGVRITESGNATRLDEGGTETYQVELTSAPTSEVTLNLTPSGDATPDVSSLTFNASNWFTPQTVTLTLSDDTVVTGDRTETIAHSIQTSDATYAALNVADVTIDITEDDFGAIQISGANNVAVTENGVGDDYTIALTSAPTENVVIQLDGGGELTFSVGGNLVTEVVFTPADWSQPRLIAIAAVGDDIAAGDRAATIIQTIVTNDPVYGAFTLDPIAVNITEDDTAGFSINATDGQTLVTEGEAADTIELVFDSQPQSPVTVSFANGTDLEPIAAVIVDETNYDQPIPVAIAAIEDSVDEGTEVVQLTVTTSSADGDYNGLSQTIDVTVQDPVVSSGELAAGLAETLNSLDEIITESLDFELPLFDVGEAAPSFISTFRDNLVNQLVDVSDGTADELGAVMETAIEDAFSTVGINLDAAVTVGVSLEEVTFDIQIGNTYETDVSLNADLGLPLLGLDIDGSLTPSFEYGLGLSFGLNDELGFFVDTANTGFNASIGASLSDSFSATGSLGFLAIEAANSADNPTEIGADFSFGLNDLDNLGGDDDGDRLTFTELQTFNNERRTNANVNFGDLFTASLTGGATVGFNVTTSLNESTVLPRFLFDLNGSWDAFSYEDGEFTLPSAPTIGFENLQVDVGSFISNFAEPVFTKINNIIDPFRPVLDFLQAPSLNFLSEDLGINRLFGNDLDPDDDGVSLLDLIGTLPNVRKFNVAPFVEAVQTVASIADLIDDISSQAQTGSILLDLGSLPEIPLPSTNFAADPNDPNVDFNALKQELQNAALPSKVDFDTEVSTGVTGRPKELLETLRGESSIAFPILTDVQNVVDLLLGAEDVSLFTLDLPALEIGAFFGTSFNFLELVDVDFGGDISIGTDLAFGYDTQGFFDWANADYAPDEAYRIFDGFYISDTENADGTGEDVDEFFGTVGIGGSAGIDLLIASGGISAGLRGDAGVDFRDTGESAGEGDGKIRAISEVGANLLTPWNLFNLTGSIYAYIAGNVKLFGGTIFDESADFTLLELEYGGDGFSISTAFDGPIQGGFVFFDANLNGIQDPNEPFTLTQADGSYNLAIPLEIYDDNGNGQIDLNEGVVVVADGFDIDTGDFQRFTYSSAADWSVTTPLTRLTLELAPIDPAAVEASVEQALGLPAGFDLTNGDPLAGIRAGDADAAAVFQVQGQLQNLIILGANTLGEALTPDPLDIINGTTSALISDDRQSGAIAIINALADRVQAGTAIDLTDETQLRAIIEAAANDIGVTPNGLDAALTALVTRNTAIAAITGTGEGIRADIAAQIAFEVSDTSYGYTLENLWTRLLGASTPTPDTSSAQTVLKSALDLPDIDISSFNAIDAIDNGELTGLEIYAAQVKVNATITQLADILDGTSGSDTGATTVINELITAIESGAVDLSDQATVATLLTAITPALPPEIIAKAAETIAGTNAEIDAIVENANPGDNLVDLRQAIAALQTVAQGPQTELLTDLAKGIVDPNEFDTELATKATLATNAFIQDFGTGGPNGLVNLSSQLDSNADLEAFLFNEGIDAAFQTTNGVQGIDGVRIQAFADDSTLGQLSMIDDDAITTSNYAVSIEDNDSLVASRTAGWDPGDFEVAFNDTIEFYQGAEGFNDDGTTIALFRNVVGLTGTQFNDIFVGGTGDESFTGDRGDDIIKGEDGNDTLLGGADNDTIIGGSGSDQIRGGTGDDQLRGGSAVGSTGSDAGDGEQDTFAFEAVNNGDDQIADFELAGPGTSGDRLAFRLDDAGKVEIGATEIDGTLTLTITNFVGQTGSVQLLGLTLADLEAVQAQSQFWDNSGGVQPAAITINALTPTAPEWFETFSQDLGENLLADGNTLASLEARLESITGKRNSDVVIGRFYQDGDDSRRIDSGAFGPDLLIGDAESTTEASFLGNDTIDGTNFDAGTGGDVIFGDFWDNNLLDAANDAPGAAGDVGQDIITADGGDDLVFGQRGNDEIFGEAGNDQLFGGSGDDLLVGGNGSDVVVGGAGRDRLLVNSKKGNDLLEGGADSDLFIFEKGGLDSHHVVRDFTLGEDQIQINSNRYGSITDLRINQNGSNTIITYSNRMDSGSITLNLISSALLSEVDFAFSS